MTIWHSGRESRLLDLMKLGEKTIEGRLNRDKFAEYKVGDEIWLRRDYRDENGELQDGEHDQLRVIVVAVHKYSDFHEMFKHEDFKKALPDATSVEEATSAYQTYYSLEDQARYGVLAIHIAVRTSQ
jgi:ASC-1-like (ASCH) protein